MSQSSVMEQVKELASTGFPIRQGVRGVHRDPDTPKDKFASDLWFSRWVHNAFENYPVASKCLGVRFLAEACHGMPAFVVGVGPSLDDQIKDLKQAQGKSIILSTDAALRALLANGITPDLVLSYDCKKEQKLLWEGVETKIPCLFSSCSHPESIRTWPGPILFFNQYHTQDELCQKILPDVFPELGQIPSAGTVGTMALLAAHALGCDPICAVGMDYCYQPTKSEVISWRYRAQDYVWTVGRELGCPDGFTPGECKELYDNDERLDRAFDVKGEYGKTFKVDPELVFYMESFSHVIPHFKVPLVNCSPEGMIPSSGLWTMPDGTEIIHKYPKMTVGEAVDTYCKKAVEGGRNVIAHLGKIAPDPRVVS